MTQRIDMSQYRVENKGNINVQGAGPATAYSVYRYDPDLQGFVHAGKWYASGYNATDLKCVKAFLASYPH